MAIKPKNYMSIFRKYNGKILDITHAKSSAGTVDIASVLEPNIETVVISAVRVTGTGYLKIFSNEGTYPQKIGTEIKASSGGSQINVSILSDRLSYQNTVKSDDFDIICHGYTVRVPFKDIRKKVN